MANIANTKDIKIADNKGLVGADNTVGVEGKSGQDFTFLSGWLDSFIKSL